MRSFTFITNDFTYSLCHAFFDGTVLGNVTERMRINQNGYIGIGTTTPGSMLEVNGAPSITSFTGTTRMGSSVGGAINTSDYSGIDFLDTQYYGTLPKARIAVKSSNSGSYLQFGTSNSYAAGVTNIAMTIDYVGNVGIGTTNPTQKLYVSGNTVVDGQIQITYGSAASKVLTSNSVGLATWESVDNMLSQGLAWNSTLDTYVRLGSILGVATGITAGNLNLPIQSAMKRCVVFDDCVLSRIGFERVNYFIDTINPINKDGTTVLLTGTTTSTVAYHLMNSAGDFVNNGVLVGMYVHSIVNSGYSMITVVTATDLTLGLDIISSGQNYEIGTARYDGSDGQIMVQIPKFYYKQDLTGTTKSWWISKYYISGFALHPAFWKDGKEVDYRYMSAFEGSMWDSSSGGMVASGSIPTQMYAAGDKLCSVANQWPKTNETRTAYRSMSQSRGTEWRQMDYYLLSAVQLLYSIEYANFNSQVMIGGGRTNLGGGSWTADSLIGRTGFSVKNGNGTASVMSGTPAVYGGDINGTGYMTDYMTYRGIENFFGNVWKFIDGMTWYSPGDNTSPIPVYVSNNSAYFADTGSVNMQLLVNATNIGGTNGGYISNIENSTGFIPSAVGASSTAKLTDYYWQYDASSGNGWRAPFFGSSSNYGSLSGVFALDASCASSIIYVHFSARLCL